MQNVHPGESEKFKYISSKVFYTHAPIKKKHVRCNQSSLMNKLLKKGVMTRNRLFNKYRKDSSTGNFFACEGQRNLCVAFEKISKGFPQ